MGTVPTRKSRVGCGVAVRTDATDYSKITWWWPRARVQRRCALQDSETVRSEPSAVPVARKKAKVVV